MNATKVTDNLIQLTKFGLMNAFLVREDDGFTLIDTTMNAADDIIAAATDAGAPIKRIAITHAHGDHVASLDALREKLGADVSVVFPEIDYRLSKGEDEFPGKKRGSWPAFTTVPDVLLHPGDSVSSLEVIATPGHTPGHVAFRDTRDNSLVIGDTFHSIGGVTVPNHFSLPFPLPYGGTCDRVEVLASAKKLRALDPSVAVFGHGKPVASPAAAMDKAIATADKKA